MTKTFIRQFKQPAGSRGQTCSVNLRIPKFLHAQIKQLAEQQNVSINKLVVDYMTEKVKDP